MFFLFFFCAAAAQGTKTNRLEQIIEKKKKNSFEAIIAFDAGKNTLTGRGVTVVDGCLFRFDAS